MPKKQKNNNKKKWKIEQRFTCPECEKPLIFRYREEIIEKSVPAVKEADVSVERDTQTTLS